MPQNTSRAVEPLIPQAFPILEFDPAADAKINPRALVGAQRLPRHCVITYFRPVIEALLQSGCLRQVAAFTSATVELPIYETVVDGTPVALVQGYVGASGAAALLEELIAMGSRCFLVCGAAGVLQKGIQVGHLIVPERAVRDEGTSYHYAAPSREIACDPHALDVIETALQREGLPYLRAKTWTTDAFYRETEAKLALRVAEGCVTVEMETAALFAVARFRGVTLGQILHGGDDLSAVEWDARRWVDRTAIQQGLVALCLHICPAL